jgi:hypothetical protein
MPMPPIDLSHIDLTLNFFTTPLLIFILGIMIRRWFRMNEEKQITKDDLAIERHTNLKRTIDTFCEKNKLDHTDIWDKLNHHAHTADGKVVDCT